MERETIDLGGVWRFQPDPSGEGAALGFARAEYDDARWREVPVPSLWDDIPGLADYEGGGWYRRWLEVPEAWRGNRVALRLYGVQFHAQVWLNGTLLATQQDPYLGCEVDLTAALQGAGRALLAICTDNIRRPGEVPGMERGWRTCGGLPRRLELVRTDPLHLAYVALTATYPRAGHLRLEATVANGRPAGETVTLVATVRDAAGARVAELRAAPVTVARGAEASASLEAHLAEVTPWTPDAPVRYAVEVALWSGDSVVDAQTLQTGFRSVAVRDGRLLLNGVPLYLTGYNRHEDLPGVGMAEDAGALRRDLVALRAAGANFVRLCHYPHHPDELDLCDELGLLAMGEIPLYWWRGEAEGEEACSAKLRAAERQLRAMFGRDCHHPSLIIWSVSNETDEQRPEVAEGNAHLVRVAQQLDPTRLAVHVSNHWHEMPHFEADDLICVNGYPGLSHRGLGGEPDYDLAEAARWWRDGLATLHALYPDKPILVAELGYAGLEGSLQGALGEDLQAQAIEAELGALDAPYVCGTTLWCWADHLWPANAFGYCHGLAVSPYGVVTRDRRPKGALAVVRRIFGERRSLAEPPRPRLAPGAAGYSLFMVRPSLEDIPEVPFPEGFGMRALRPDEGGLWEDIERDAEPYFRIAPGQFAQVFGSDPQAIAWRCYAIIDARGVAVGTMSAWFDRDYFGDVWGVVHWVAVRPAYQRRGLARAGLAYTLRQLARWHTRAYLNTQSYRLGAIRLYLEMGFRPDLRHPGAREAWESVRPAMPDIDLGAMLAACE